ncbi:hypothetical protein KIN20_027947 [Parelaphostrongylus tenuis]|uniref:Uncharacterized protein n=1 Tax=Parelaphostrongylus tenuis TaxID=148309 RepID=A0AAD5R0Q1_PARTN|nr:hypothetical protein KIN20_027947 [Parelaphostrongylus tenuis]
MEGYVLCDEEMLDIEPPFDDSLKEDVVVMDIQKDCGFGNIINRVDTMFDNEVRRVIFRGVGDAKKKCMVCVEVIKNRRQNVLGLSSDKGRAHLVYTDDARAPTYRLTAVICN